MPNHGVFVHQRMKGFASVSGWPLVVVAPVPWAPFRWSGKNWVRVPERESWDGVDVYHPRYFMIPKLSMRAQGWLMYAWSKELVSRLVKERNAGLIDSHYLYPDGYAAMLLAREFSLPYSVSARGTDANYYPNFPSIRRKLRTVVGRANVVISVSEAVQGEVNLLGNGKGPSLVVRNGVNDSLFHPEDRLTCRRRLGLHETKRVVISVGSLIPRKNHPLLIKAYKACQGCPWFASSRLYIIGEGPLGKELAHLIESLELGGQARLIGAVANMDLRTWYSAADFSCLVSSREGCANVINESLACGTPVLATNVWGAPEVIQQGRNGLLVGPSEREIAAGLNDMANRAWDQQTVRQLSGIPSWECVGGQLLEAFQIARSPTVLTPFSSRSN